MCVWGLFELVLLLHRQFYTQLAPQEISPPLSESAQTQECAFGLCLDSKALCYAYA